MNTEDDYLRAVDQSGEMLFQRYKEQREGLARLRSLGEFQQHESQVLAALRENYRDQLAGIRFLRPDYFSTHESFRARQDIAPEYFVTQPSTFYLVSHRWESQSDPDPSRRQFLATKAYLERLPPSESDKIGLWYDYSCLPQVGVGRKRTIDEEAEFTATLKVIHLLAALGHTIVLSADDYLQRSWCCAEWILASRITPIMLDSNAGIAFGNRLKYRQLAMLTLFLNHDAEFRLALLDSKRKDDSLAIPFLNSCLRATMLDTEVTDPDDKFFLWNVLHRHFWRHVQLLGLINQLAIALLSLDQYDDKTIRWLLKEFVFLSGDPELKWTKQALLNMETMIEDCEDSKEFVFDNIEVQVNPKSKRWLTMP